jgi:BirA family transcriptional regulator, biotin operon repressor / biotin---[acetyl-CoA-carboxylase] ligase
LKSNHEGTKTRRAEKKRSISPTLSSAFDLKRLRRDVKPFRLHWFSRLRSTNDHAALLRKRGELFAPSIVLTSHQIAGRGRGANSWWSGKGSLTVTFAFAIDQHLAPYHIPLIAGLAVRNAAAELTGNDEIQLKWPNDLLFHGRKLAGLLCERISNADLIGLGMNVNVNNRLIPKSLKTNIVSLDEIAGQPLDMTAILSAIAKHLHRMLSHRDEQSFAAVVKEYDRHHALLGRRVVVEGSGEEPSITGTCQGLDEMGRLLLKDRRITHRIIAGHVRAI